MEIIRKKDGIEINSVKEDVLGFVLALCFGALENAIEDKDDILVVGLTEAYTKRVNAYLSKVIETIRDEAKTKEAIELLLPEGVNKKTLNIKKGFTLKEAIAGLSIYLKVRIADEIKGMDEEKSKKTVEDTIDGFVMFFKDVSTAVLVGPKGKDDEEDKERNHRAD